MSNGGSRPRLARAVVAVTVAIVMSSSSTRGANETARQIVDEAQKRTEAKSQRYEGLLRTIEANGKTTEKRWIQERIGAHGHSRAVIRFTTPAEVKGVALLIVNYPDRTSDQWMWTPAIERDRRIATQDRSTRFFGTDFTFEDLEEREADQFDYTLSGDDAIDTVGCWKLESVPKQTKSSQYTKSTVWIRKDNYGFARIESYIKEEVVRRLTYTDFSNIQGIWTARELTMADLRRHSVTHLTLDKVEYNLPLKADSFTLQGIRQ